MVKRFICVALSLAFLLSSVFLYKDISTAQAQEEPGYAIITIRAPSETLDESTISVAVDLTVPEGVTVGGIFTTLYFDPSYFYYADDALIVNSNLVGGASIFPGSFGTIRFAYQEIDSTLTAGTFELFRVEFTVAEDVPEGEYNFCTYTDDLYDNALEMNDLLFEEGWANVYAGERFEVTVPSRDIAIGQQVEVTANKTISDFANHSMDPDVLSYENEKITGLKPGNGLLVFTAETGEVTSLSIHVMSADATLFALSASNATFSPAFSPDTFSYTAAVPYTVDKLNLSYTAASAKATTLSINPTLTVGGVINVQVIVTAEDSLTSKAYTIAVTREKPPYPDKIASTKYTVGTTYISKIPVGTTVSTLLNGMNDSQYIQIYRANGTLATTTERVSTGFTARLMHGTTLKQTVTIVVTGDANGDGKTTASDYVNVKFDVLGKSKLKNAYAVAADVNGDGKITATDYVNIKFYVLGKTSINTR